jgi:serine phosphatase RsbU (regulator of sigma subunit)
MAALSTVQEHGSLVSMAENDLTMAHLPEVIRILLTVAEIKQVALGVLARALSADRCLSVRVDTARNCLTIVAEWHRPGLRPLLGDFRFSGCAPTPTPSLKGRESAGQSRDPARPQDQKLTQLVVPDMAMEPRSHAMAQALGRLDMRALIAVPVIEDADQVELLCVGMVDGAREWHRDHVKVVEQVALLTRTAVEAVENVQREHRIASELQAALLPKLPHDVPGLELADYYRPALDESEVGGDFADVFTLDNDISFLVVGDVSGKGLAAAAQMATVRNMLRFALYHGRTLAGPIVSLNRMLVDKNMLEGFVTLFVGRYDRRTHTLAYVNCGQEPALIKRAATGLIEELDATGPVLGVFELAHYQETIVRIDAGDTLVAFTDGLTEAGPSRDHQLGVDGLKVLLQKEKNGEHSGRAEGTLEQLMAGVDAYSRGGSRDDMCMLVGVVNAMNNE